MDCMFMGDGVERKTYAFLVTKAVFSTAVPRKSAGEWICRRLLAWLREIGFEFVDIVVKSDNEAALTSLIETWSMMEGNARWIEDHRREQRR